MTEAIWAVWYDLDEGDERPVVEWLHDAYLPFLKQAPGIAWVAHYRNVGTGPALATYHELAGHADADDALGSGSQYVILAGAPSPHTFVKPPVLDMDLPHGF